VDEHWLQWKGVVTDTTTSSPADTPAQLASTTGVDGSIVDTPVFKTKAYSAIKKENAKQTYSNGLNHLK